MARLVFGYLRCFARLQLCKNSQAVKIGVTGSTGKSSTVEAIALILNQVGRVKRTSGFNSQSGLPLSLLGLTPRDYSLPDWLRLCLLAPLQLLTNWERFEYLVVELGIDSPQPPGNMAALLSILKPDIGVVLGAGLAHAAAYDHLVKDRDPARRAGKIISAIAREKMSLLHAVSPTGVAIYNRDHPALLPFAKSLKTRVLTFGTHRAAKLRYQLAHSSRDMRINFSYRHQKLTLELGPYLEESYGATLGAALSVAVALDLPLDQSVQALGSFRPPPGRQRVFPGLHGMTILDSSYNASPASTLASLQLLSRVSSHHHKIAIIGDMRELGQESKLAHKALADQLCQYADQALLLGELTRAYTYPVLKSRRFPARHFSRMSELVQYASSHLPPGSFVLIKGSQDTLLLERAVQALLANPADEIQLCRRGPYWDKIRASTP